MSEPCSRKSVWHLTEIEAEALRGEIRGYCTRTSTQLGDLVRVANTVGTERVGQFLHHGGAITRSVATKLRSTMARASAGCALGRPRPVGDEPQGWELNGEALAARIARDQAHLRAEQLRWLSIEQEKYGLPRRGRHIEEMAA